MFEREGAVYDSRRPIAPHQHLRPTTEKNWVKVLLIGIALVYMLAIVVLPLIQVFFEAFRKGFDTYLASFEDRGAQTAIQLTLTVAAIAVPLNLVFGVAASWAVAKFEFWGKSFLITLIDLPFSVSPVVSGMVYVLLFGAQSVLGPWLKANDIEIIFAVPGIVLATVFVTFPFIARELIPLMQAQGNTDEEADLARRQRLANLLARDSPQHQMGPALWRAALQCPGDGRVRGGVGGVRPYPRTDDHHAARDRDPL